MAGYMSTTVFPRVTEVKRAKTADKVILHFRPDGDEFAPEVRVFLDPLQLAILTDLLDRESTRHWEE